MPRATSAECRVLHPGPPVTRAGAGALRLSALSLFLLCGAIATAADAPATHRVHVDYAPAARAALSRQYDFVVGELPFPTGHGARDLDVILFGLDTGATTAEVRGALAANGLRAATWPELMALGAQHPAAVKAAGMVAALGTTLGTTNACGPLVGIIGGASGGPGAPQAFLFADTSCREGRWKAGIAFAAVRK